MYIKTFLKKAIKFLDMKLLKMKYERTFKTKESQVKYLFFPKKQSTKLLVVFSAFPGKNRPAVYNYIRTFSNEEYNRLYILDDFGPDIRGGSYYLGKNKVFLVEEAVSLLIKKVADQIGVETKDIVTTGTSKGGFASLYFSFKYNYGSTIVGAPQTLLGDYLSDHKSYFEYIAGPYSEENRKYLNNLLFDVVKKRESKPNVYLHVGKGDHHYEDHILPFCELLEDENISYTLDVQDYDSHAQVGEFYPEFALKSLSILLRK